MSDVKHTNIGLVDDGVTGYELRSPQSYLRYGYSPSTNIFFVYNIGTPNPDDRGNGYAKQLIQMFLNWSRPEEDALMWGHILHLEKSI